MAQRPLSPHLSIWKWGPHMAASIVNRIAGDGLALVGLAVLVWWLGALASGPEAYDSFTGWMTTPLGWVVLVGLSWAFFAHTMTGIRHLVLDVGAGYELTTNKSWAVIVLAGGVLLTIAFWAAILFLK